MGYTSLMTPIQSRQDIIPEVDFSGLSLITHAFIPHFNTRHPESEAITRAVDFYKKERIPFRAYRDGEVLIQVAQSAPSD